MTNEENHWEAYYRKVQGRAVRPLLINALDRFAPVATQGQRTAIDLGCGDGTESALLLERGWKVHAIDGEPAAISWLATKVPPEHQGHLQTQVAQFENVELVPTDLLFAGHSLPFCRPDHFAGLWNKIVDAIKTDGRFAGSFFGVRDSWASNPTMTFHTEEQVHAMLTSFEIESFHEQDEDGQAASGPKHWHVFSVVARKR
jgi:trans-aconitate methyltransferase